MGLTTALIAGAGLMGAASSISQGYAAQSEYEQQAKAYQLQQQGYNKQADLLNVEINALDQMSILDRSRSARQRGRVEGTILARTAKAGFTLYGSPLAVLVDDLTQLRLDEAIGEFNIEMAKFNVRSEQYQLRSGAVASGSAAARARSSGKTAVAGGYTNAFSTLLKTGAYMGMRGGGGSTPSPERIPVDV